MGIRSSRALLAWTLGSFLLIAACTIGAGELLGLVERADGPTGVDSSITSWVVAHRAQAPTTLARVMSTIGGAAVVLPCVALAALLLVRRRRMVLAGLLVAGWLGSVGLYSLTKLVVGRHRPPMDIWLTKAADSSFPSGHATGSVSAFLAFTVVAAVLASRLRWPALALALLLGAGVGWSRVYLGVHWATDVWFGWVVALVWIATVARLARAARSIWPPEPTGAG